jgi:hypothetical protein
MIVPNTVTDNSASNIIQVGYFVCVEKKIRYVNLHSCYMNIFSVFSRTVLCLRSEVISHT